MSDEVRLVLHVSPVAVGRTWEITVEGKPDQPLLRCATQTEALREAQYLARQCWEQDRRPAQIKIHRPDGRIREERTFGRDPVATPG